MNRRTMLALVLTSGCQIAARSACADDPKGPEEERLFSTGPLSDNAVAGVWTTAPASIQVPDVTLQSVNGPQHFSSLKGKVRIITLWAEWCAPCLLELHDLAVLRKSHHDSRFDVMGIAQATRLSNDQSNALFRKYGASDLPSWFEPHNAKIAEAAAVPLGAKGFSMPCNLLLDKDGRIRGRAFGTHLLTSRRVTSVAPAAHLDPLSLIGAPTVWSSPDARTFVQALKAGVLDRV